MADAYVSTLRFVASHCGAPDPEPSTSGPKQVVCKGGIKGLAAGARHLAEQSPSAQQLLGATPELQAQVDEWLSWASTELTPLTDDKLLKVNSFLSSRTYLVGGSLTVADLVIFGVVGPAVVTFPAAQTLHFSSLLRWYDLLQNTVPAATALPRLALAKPRFQAPVAAAPAAPSGSGAASSAASASTAAAGGAAAGKAAPAKGATPAAAAAAPAAAPAAAAAAPAAAAPAKGKAAKAAAAESKPAAADKAPAAATAAAAPAAGDGKGKGKGGGGKAAAAADEEPRIDMLDLRVGKIVKVGKHPNADALYLEEIDVGEEKPRQVISGLVNFVPLERMQDRRVVVVCNLKPAKMRDVMSYGMVLCASNETHDKVEPVDIPEGVPVGERIKVAGYDNAPVEEVNPKKKVLEQLFPDMRTDAAGVPVYKGAQFLTSKGPLTSTIPSGWVK